MTLDSLSLVNFKNIASTTLEFSPEINCFLGNNGMGKSNLLDAIYMLSFTRSFSGMTDAMVIRRGEEFATARARYTRHGESEELTMGLAKGRRKSLKRAGKEYRRLSSHIGVYPLVIAAPHDVDLIRGSGEERRRWMDMVISQSNPRYLDALIRYNAGIEQRNRMLRDEITDTNLYLAIETALDAAASIIHSARKEWASNLARLVRHYYLAIAGDNAEKIDMTFCGSLDNAADCSLLSLLESVRSRDIILHHTSVGPHRDDIEFTIDNMPMRRAASQGQSKSFTLALRFAQYAFLRNDAAMKPILLLDDIFDKLDARRVERIMELVASPEFGQIFITDTNRKHLDDIIERIGGHHRLWSVADGVFTPLS